MSQHSKRPNLRRGPLFDFLSSEVYPRLDAERVFSHASHDWTRKNERELVGGCPFHDSKSGKAFNVRRSNLVWYCHSCKFGGGPIEYRARLNNIACPVRGPDFIRLARELAHEAGIHLPENTNTDEEIEHLEYRRRRSEILEACVAHYQVNLWSDAGAEARRYLREDRGFSDDEIRDLQFGLSLGPEPLRTELTDAKRDVELAASCGLFSSKWRNYVAVPWRDERGEMLNIYGRYAAKLSPDGQPKTLSLPGDEIKQSPLYLDRALRAGCDVLVVVEGIFDAAMAQVRGDVRCVALAGVQISEAQARTLRECRIPSVTLCLDPDRAGDDGSLANVKKIQAINIAVRVAPRLPDGIDPDDFIHANGIDVWRAHIERAIEGGAFRINHLLALHQKDGAWTDEGKSSFLAAAEADGLRDAGAKVVVDDVLARARDHADDVAAGALKSAATMRSLALLKCFDRAAFEAVLIDLRKLGLKVKDVEALKAGVAPVVEKIEEAAAAERRKESSGTESLQTVDPGLRAPVPSTLRIPRGVTVDAGGVMVMKTDRNGNPVESSISPSPILISARYVDIDENVEKLSITWRRDGGWRKHVTPRRAIADVRTILDLSNVGFPVTSLNAVDLVEYLTNLEQINLDVLPRIRMTHRLGWHRDGERDVFLWGESLIDEAGVHQSNEAGENLPLTFHAHDVGDEQIVKGFRASGSLESWQTAVAPIIEFPPVVAGLLASLSTPLLRIVSAPNLIVDYCGTTSGGKTTALRTAASAWGNPDEKSGGSIVHTWDSTRVFAERLATTVHSLPLLLDETSMARGQGRLVSELIYQIASGQGRGRGSLRGVRATGSFNCAMVTTGEQPLTSFSEGHGGTYARSLSFWGSPFGDANRAQLVDSLNASVFANYGHAGPTFVLYLLRHRDRWAEWCTSYRESVENFQAAATNHVAARLARAVATLDIAAKIAAQGDAGVVPWTYADMAASITAAWGAATAGAGVADRSKEALAKLISWSRRNHDKFARTVGTNGPVPQQGWAGVWDEVAGWTHLAFFPDQLERLLDDWDFSPKATLNSWRDQKWLDVSDADRLTKQIRFDGRRVRMYAVPRAVVDAFEPEERADG